MTKNYSHGKRMVREDLIAQIGEGGGSEYTAGTGIDITENVISVDDETVALKTDIITSYNDLTDKPTIPTVTASITQGSTDAVTSGAVYNAIGDIESLLAAI